MCYEPQELNTHPLSKEELLSVMLWCGFISTTQLYEIKPELTHCPWAQVFDKHLNRLIYLGYWSSKHWKCLVGLSKEDAKANINLVNLNLDSYNIDQKNIWVEPLIQIFRKKGNFDYLHHYLMFNSNGVPIAMDLVVM